MPIQLLGAEWEPQLPASFVQRQEIIMAHRDGVEDWRQVRVWGAAIGATWAHPKRRLQSSMQACGYDPQVYGEAVANELQAEGVEPGAIVVQGIAAYNAIARSMISQDEIDQRAGFSNPVAPPSGPAGATEIGSV